jgi:uncharacterized protein YxjI
MLNDLSNYPHLLIRQKRELVELLGVESKNCYEILGVASPTGIENSEHSQQFLATAAEKGEGILNVIMRQFLRHWRTFSIEVKTKDGEVLVCKHPFRFYFSRLEIEQDGVPIGVVERKFSILSKKFTIFDGRGRELMDVKSPIWRIWTFPYTKNGREVARVQKKWTGALKEMFLDADTFHVEFLDSSLPPNERLTILFSALYIDLMFFEQNNGFGLSSIFNLFD